MNQVLNNVPIAYSASGIRCQVMDGGDRNVEGWLGSALTETALTARALSLSLALTVVWNVTRCGVKERYHRFGRTCCSPEVILRNPRKILSFSRELRSLQYQKLYGRTKLCVHCGVCVCVCVFFLSLSLFRCRTAG